MRKHGSKYFKRRWWRRFTLWPLTRLFLLIEEERQGKIELHIHYRYNDRRLLF